MHGTKRIHNTTHILLLAIAINMNMQLLFDYYAYPARVCWRMRVVVRFFSAAKCYPHFRAEQQTPCFGATEYN